ncbi:MAG TPA: DoxX family protein, partial [Candidatus Cloacimonadota bacterium]|nr:DoxX family protein [Candidatus Cloacimonadota bacterium]
MSRIAILSRICAGLVFIFSGFVKAVDPLGSTYKFIDYFHAFNLPWLEQAAFPLAILLSGSEFLIGVCLLLFIRNKLANWGALLFMAGFTPLTFWLALTNPVQDCGCFGDAIILSNWQTFYKNILISALVIISFIYRNSTKHWMSIKAEWV